MKNKGVSKADNVVLDLDRFVPGPIAWISNRLDGSAAKAYRSQFDIGITEWRILSYLAVFGKGTGAQMSSFMGADKAAVSRSAASLLKKQMISSQQGVGRNLDFQLLSKGRKVHDRLVQFALDRERALLTGLKKAEVEVLIGFLHTMMDNLSKVEAIDPTQY